MSNLGLCWALYSQFFAQITKKPLRLNGVIFPQPCNAANLALESDHKLVPIVNDAATPMLLLYAVPVPVSQWTLLTGISEVCKKAIEALCAINASPFI